jgi:hypothetical protein
MERFNILSIVRLRLFGGCSAPQLQPDGDSLAADKFGPL